MLYFSIVYIFLFCVVIYYFFNNFLALNHLFLYYFFGLLEVLTSGSLIFHFFFFFSKSENFLQISTVVDIFLCRVATVLFFFSIISKLFMLNFSYIFSFSEVLTFEFLGSFFAITEPVNQGQLKA